MRRETQWMVCLVATLLAGGCTGKLYIEAGDSGVQRIDGGVDARADDGSVSPRDGATTDAPGMDGALVDSGSLDAPTLDGGVDAGFDGGMDAGPCASVTCAATEICDEVTMRCVCREGYVDQGGACVLAEPGDPATRDMTEVCAAWNDGHMQRAASVWDGDGSECGPGAMSREAIEDTLRRINMYRWLAGLPNVTDNPDEHAAQMECAAMMSANRMLSHSPPDSWQCHTSAGAGAAGRSNIGLGYGSSAHAIQGYMDDSGVASLGHRRWILNNALGRVGIGYSQVGGRGGQCLSVFDFGGSTPRTWTAYPNPGPAPLPLARFRWSFQGYSVGLNRDTDAEVVRLSDGQVMSVTSEVLFGGGLPDTLKMTLNGWSASAGESYRVTIRGLSGGDISYEVQLVDC